VVKKRMPEITTPTLVLHSLEDDITSRWNADYVERKLGGPVVKVLLDDCYHMITVDLQYHRVIDLSVDFIHQRFIQQRAAPQPLRREYRQLA
jgi:carboxylesterase